MVMETITNLSAAMQFLANGDHHYFFCKHHDICLLSLNLAELQKDSALSLM